MDNKLNEIRRKISFLRSEMLRYEDTIRKQLNRDEDVSHSSMQLMAMRVVMLGLIAERNRLGGEEQLLNVNERLKVVPSAASYQKARSAAVSDDPVEWKIQTLRGQLLELGSAIRQLHQSGLDSATAQLLLSRKRAELDDLMKRGRAGDVFSE
jgi:hypothetical protein